MSFALRICFMLMGAAVLCGAQTSAAAPANSEEAHTCVGCHAPLVKSFADHPHARLTTGAGATGMACASCHGPGKAHVDSGGAVSSIFNPAEADVNQVDHLCLSCHAGKQAAAEHPVHGNVSCTGCHSIHAAGAPVHMLKVTQTQLCYQCHGDIKPQFSMPYRHKEEEALVQCTDCHDPHDTSRGKLLSSPAQQEAVCTTCHTETAGPFRYEHPVVRTEGCTACHVPHGGSNPHMLNQANVDALCHECHLPSLNSTTGVLMGAAHDPAAPSKPCTGCHQQVHGSSASSVFFSRE